MLQSSKKMEMKSSPAADLIERARMELFLKWPLWGSLAMHLVLVEVIDADKKRRIWGGNTPTMATDGIRLYYTAEFVRTLTFPELCGVVAHEGGHYGLAHCLRLLFRDHMAWNVCTDAGLNAHLKADGLTLPSDAIYIGGIAHNFDFSDGVVPEVYVLTASAEELYARIKKQPCGGGGGQGAPKPGQQDGNKGGKQPLKDPRWGNVVKPEEQEGKTPTQDELEQAEHDAKVNLISAVERAESTKAGNVPQYIKDMVTKMTAPQVDWKQVLRQFVTGGVPTRYTFKRPNRRYQSPDFIMPSMQKKNYGTFVIFIDTSGSMKMKFLQQILGEMNAISRDIEYDEIIVVPVDYIVHESGVKRYQRGEIITEVDLVGRGGTSFIPAFEWLDEQTDITPTRVIYMTDLYGSFLENEYKVPTLWITDNNQVAPWGKTITVKPE